MKWISIFSLESIEMLNFGPRIECLETEKLWILLHCDGEADKTVIQRLSYDKWLINSKLVIIKYTL